MLPTLRGIRGSIAPLKGLRVASRVAAPSTKTVTFMPVFGRTMFTMAKAPSNRVTTMCLRSVFPKRFFAEAAEEAPKSNVPMVVSVVRNTKKATKTAMYVTIAFVVLCCGYITAYYMWPSPISPQRIFTDAFNVVKLNDRINQLLGGHLKGYGVDLDSQDDGHATGRRNMIQNISFMGEDGIPRCRIVFNVEGKNGKGLVYAEKSKEMGKGQFYYLIFVQPETNKIIPIYDNREYVEREKMQEEIVKQLKQRKAIMYGHRGYDITFKQLDEFGKYAKDINVIDCAVKSELCQQLQIMMVPSWSIDGIRYRGFIRLEDFDTVLHPLVEQPSPMDKIKEFWSKMKDTLLSKKNEKKSE